MMSNAALSLRTPACRLVLPRPASSMAPAAGLADPAVNVMTDLTKSQVIVVRDITPIDEALAYMKDSGVRLLFVVDDGQRLVGLITSTDIQGEKPLRYLHSIGCMHTSCTRVDVLVRDIMVPVAAWQVLDFWAVKRATVSQIVSAFKATGRRHLVVVEASDSGMTGIVRGLFSASRLEQFLQQSIETLCTATSFSEIEQVLAHPYGHCD